MVGHGCPETHIAVVFSDSILSYPAVIWVQKEVRWTNSMLPFFGFTLISRLAPSNYVQIKTIHPPVCGSNSEALDLK